MKKEAEKMANQLVKIDNALKEVYHLSGGRQKILFHKEIPFRTLVELAQLIPDCRVMAGRSWSFYMANCTICIRRNLNTR